MSTQIQEERKTELLKFRKEILGANLYLAVSIKLPSGYIINEFFSEMFWDFNTYLRNVVIKKEELNNLLNEMVNEVEKRYYQLINSADYVEFSTSSRAELELRGIIWDYLKRIYSLLTQ